MNIQTAVPTSLAPILPQFAVSTVPAAEEIVEAETAALESGEPEAEADDDLALTAATEIAPAENPAAAETVEAAVPGPEPALPSLDAILNELLGERVERLRSARAANAARAAEVQAVYQAIADRISAVQAARATEIAAAQAVIAKADAALADTVAKADLVRLYAADSNSAAADQADAVADAAVVAANKALNAARLRLDTSSVSDETAKKNEADDLDFAALVRDEALRALAEELAAVELEYADTVQELQRRERAEAERQVERARREAERTAGAARLVARAQKATGENRLQAILDEARSAKVLHLVEKHIATRRRELATAQRAAFLFARTLPELPTGDVLAVAAVGTVDVFYSEDGQCWFPWRSWAGISGIGCCREVGAPRNKTNFKKGEIFALAARKGGQVVSLCKVDRAADGTTAPAQ